MKVYFIGAGPGAPDLITLRGAELISRCKVLIYTGSLVPRELLDRAPAGAKIEDSAKMTLDEIMASIQTAADEGLDVARVHTGDPSVFGSTAEQMRRLKKAGIDYEIVPGVSSFAAAAAAIGRELTIPELTQSVILTRAEGRTPVPEKERLEELGRHGSTLCLFLSITLLSRVSEQLSPHYGGDCPVAVVYKASCPDQKIVWGTLQDIAQKVRDEKINSQSMVLVGRALEAEDFAESRLYASDFTHRFRKKKT